MNSVWIKVSAAEEAILNKEYLITEGFNQGNSVTCATMALQIAKNFKELFKTHTKGPWCFGGLP